MPDHLQVHNKICIAICTPIPFVQTADGTLVHDTISPLWHRARTGLGHPTNINLVEFVVDGCEVGDARNKAARQCLNHQPCPPEHCFFLDYDVLPHFDAMTKLFFRARCFPKIDIFAGVYCCKYQNPPDPLIYAGDGQGPFWDWTVGDLLTTESHGITGVHSGLTLVRVSLYQRLIDAGLVHGDGCDLQDEPWYLTQRDQRRVDGGVWTRSGTEDLYFCRKAIELGAQIMVDTSVLAGHHDKKTGKTYGLPWDEGPCGRAAWMTDHDGKAKDEKAAAKDGLKIAIDVGAGNMRREEEGYKLYTTDIRKDSGADYIQDTRMLNLPDNHFHKVKTAHHLEHFGRYEQEQIWAELVRICKPGGKVEFVIPNLKWAAGKILEGSEDERTYDVLYGAQERFEFDRELNTHYFGYTTLTALALAQSVGLENISIRTYEDDPALQWEMVLEATKPEFATEEPKPEATNGDITLWDGRIARVHAGAIEIEEPKQLHAVNGHR